MMQASSRGFLPLMGLNKQKAMTGILSGQMQHPSITFLWDLMNSKK
jgi:hypothetical protein